MAYSTREGALSEKVIEYLKDCMDRGLPLLFEHRSGRTDKLGVPDVWFSVNGVHVECELKAEDGKLSSAQRRFKWRCESQYNVLHIVPRTLKEVQDIVEQLL